MPKKITFKAADSTIVMSVMLNKNAANKMQLQKLTIR